MFALRFAAIAVSSVVLVPALAFCQTPPAIQHQHEGGSPPERLGTVHFENSCDPALRQDFDRAVALLHSFWYGASASAFTKIGEKDPNCAIAWWGVAMSRWGNPFAGQRPEVALKEGGAAVAKATSGGKPTDREAMYIAAVAELFKDYEKVPQRTRVLNYERAMQALHEKNPQDREAAAFYALAVNQTALPTDKTYAQQLKAASILQELFAEQPDHPGVAHYLIHAYDHPPLAERALPAAQRYAKIAPDAPHALHMPSHTFTRVGYWEDSIATNEASAKAARKANSPGEVLHALDYQVYAYLQTGQDRAAKGVLDQTAPILKELDAKEQYTQAGLYALAAIPARYALERGAWADAAALTPRETNMPYTDAITYFARAVGAARSGDATGAHAAARKLGELQSALAAKGEEYWAQQVQIQQISAQAWATFAEGEKEEAVRLLREAVAIEDSTDKSAISPGPLAPARELLGEMLLQLDRPADALTELEAVVKKEPNRFRATYHAARAATLTGDREKGSKYYAALLRIAEKADTPPRPELEEARQAIRQRKSTLPLR
jgi:tetratricopeptide (TPR) repeat protein